MVHLSSRDRVPRWQYSSLLVVSGTTETSTKSFQRSRLCSSPIYGIHLHRRTQNLNRSIAMFSAIGRAAIGRIGGGRSAARVSRQIQRVQVTQSGRNELQSDFQGRALVILPSSRLYSASATEPAKKRATKKPAAAKELEAAAKKRAAAKKSKGLTEKQKEKKEEAAVRLKLQNQRKKEKKVVEDGKTKIRELKAKVLTPPKRLPATAWTVLHVESMLQSPGVPLAELVKDASARYKTLDASTREVGPSNTTTNGTT